MTIASEFKDDPLGFMKDNVVRVRYYWGNLKLDMHKRAFDCALVGQQSWMTLRRSPDNIVAKDKRNEMRLGMYDLVDGKQASRDDRILAYWCPYRDNETLGVMLGDRAQFMFTAEMSGCTLGLGSPTHDGSILVFHSNLRSQSQYEDQETELAKLGVSKSLKPQKYKSQEFGGGQRITTFGVREKKKWRLYYQVHRYTTMTAINLMGVNPVTGITA